MASDYWVISPRRFKHHPSFEAAEAELYRLQLKHPASHFRIYRCKKHLTRSDTFPRLVEAVKRLLAVHPVPVFAGGVVDFRNRVDQVTAEDEVRSIIALVDPNFETENLKEAAQ